MFCYIKNHSWDQKLLLGKHDGCEHKKRLNFCTQYKISTAFCDFTPKCWSWRIVGAVKDKKELDLMFMKHYAPNRCLYIKMVKFRTGVGSAETSYLQNCSVKLFKEHFKVQICKGRLFEKNKITFFLITPINLLIILYQLTKFEAPSCYSFWDIMITNFHNPNLQREIIRKK